VDAVVIRSCWDYHLREREFSRWIGQLEQTGTTVINPPELVRWNRHKNYIGRLADQGIPVVPTVWIRRGDARSLRDVLGAAGWKETVVKPAISASAYETWRVADGEAEAHEERFARLRAEGDVLVQQYLPEVTRDGEWSLMFFGLEYSHAVRKLPKSGDFRVQTEHGGSVASDVAPPRLIDDARLVLQALPVTPVYCRVDGVIVDDMFMLMEVECIDPVLFFTLHQQAAGRFADEVMRRIG
ncbi:MAG: ATP-grasp domain-containing protein, partial [Longimicrobiales bacterium]